jgi:hypothetical protein
LREQLAERLDCYALVDLMGHQRIAGHVSEATIAGGAFIRVDVPAVGEDVAHTRYFGPSAIYSISPVSEEVARAMAASLRQRPVQPYELPQLKAPEGADGQPVDRRRVCADCGGLYTDMGNPLCGECQEAADIEADPEGAEVMGPAGPDEGYGDQQ